MRSGSNTPARSVVIGQSACAFRTNWIVTVALQGQGRDDADDKSVNRGRD
jgi:hypothetical protein